MNFYPNQRGGAASEAIPVASLSTFWYNAAPETPCTHDASRLCSRGLGDRVWDFAVLHLERPAAGEAARTFNLSYSCSERGWEVASAGYPALPGLGWPTRMYSTTGRLEPFAGCRPLSSLADQVVSSDLDLNSGQSGAPL